MSERLFRILGLIADDLIEEAGRSASRRRPWRNFAAAACVVLCAALPSAFWQPLVEIS